MTNLVPLSSGRVNYLQLPYVGDGEAEDVVMIHGLGANVGFWFAGAAQWLVRFGRVTLYDLAGHGKSEMPQSGYTPRELATTLGELLDHLGLHRVHLVAHSFGGVVALAFALRHPERVKSLVLADVRLWDVELPSVGSEDSPWLPRMRHAGLRLEHPHMDLSVQVLVDLAYNRLEGREAASAITAALPGVRFLFRGRKAAKTWIDLIETTQAYKEMTSTDGLTVADLPKITQPMLAAYGENSRRRRTARTLQRLCPNCELQEVPTASHFFPLTRPRLFASVALPFLRGLAADPLSLQELIASIDSQNHTTHELASDGVEP